MSLGHTMYALALLAVGLARTPAAPTTTPPAPAARSTTAAVRAVAGTYVVQRVNGRALPFTDRMSTGPGYEYRGHLDRALLRLDPKGTYELTTWYAYTHAQVGERARPDAADDHFYNGTWTLAGGTITLTPLSKRGRRQRPLVGQVGGGQLTVRVEINTGVAARAWLVQARLDPSYF